MHRIAQLETFARAGYAARALVYFMLGYLTLATQQSEGTSSVLENIKDLPAGEPLLVLTGLGLAAYGIYRLYCAAMDLDGKGDDAKGIGKRIGQAASGIAHLGLCFLAFRIVFMSAQPVEGETSSQAANTALGLPGGNVLIIIVAIAFACAAIQQAKNAWTGEFMALMDSGAPHWTEVSGRIGYGARAIVFTVLAWNIGWAAFGGGTDGLSSQAALDQLKEHNWLYITVAAGLLVFGVFSLVMARYRRIQDENILARLRAETKRFT